MPNVDQDLGQEYQFILLSHSDLNLCTPYGPTYLCKGHDMLISELNKILLGAYYLENIDSI
jgi:hypothetical protein